MTAVCAMADLTAGIATNSPITLAAMAVANIGSGTKTNMDPAQAGPALAGQAPEAATAAATTVARSGGRTATTTTTAPGQLDPVPVAQALVARAIRAVVSAVMAVMAGGAKSGGNIATRMKTDLAQVDLVQVVPAQVDLVQVDLVRAAPVRVAPVRAVVALVGLGLAVREPAVQGLAAQELAVMAAITAAGTAVATAKPPLVLKSAAMAIPASPWKSPRLPRDSCSSTCNPPPMMVKWRISTACSST
ncbi:hypothetical protein NBRC116598_14330 [Pseudophaeobacter arcticus]|uniref:Uncharacterized protein n=1 Tax=Pseudophaeobacter arcticus TaxID=385492 RepID=A0ABQ0AJE5_9RHOB